MDEPLAFAERNLLVAAVIADEDADWLKDTLEPGYHRGYNPYKTATYADTVDYGTNPIPDYEDDCMRATTAPYGVDVLWSNGTADAKDWAYPGKQYH